MSSLILKYIKQAKMAGKYFVWWAKMKKEGCGRVYWWAASASHPPTPPHWPQRNKQDKHYLKGKCVTARFHKVALVRWTVARRG